MPMYTFYLRTEDGAPRGLDAIELAHDAASFARAGELLDHHLTCDYVEVWTGDRPVLARHREQPIIRPIAEAEVVHNARPGGGCPRGLGQDVGESLR